MSFWGHSPLPEWKSLLRQWWSHERECHHLVMIEPTNLEACCWPTSVTDRIWWQARQTTTAAMQLQLAKHGSTDHTGRNSPWVQFLSFSNSDLGVKNFNWTSMLMQDNVRTTGLEQNKAITSRWGGFADSIIGKACNRCCVRSVECEKKRDQAICWVLSMGRLCDVSTDVNSDCLRVLRFVLMINHAGACDQTWIS